MATLAQFANRMKLRASSVGVNANTLVKKVAHAVGTTVIPATPIDTSRARMNWQSSVDAPKSGVLAAYPTYPSNTGEGAQVALSSLSAAIGAYSGQRGGIYIVNNLHYIMDLNNGSSAQAPANFVALAVMSGARAVATVKLIT